MTPSRILPLLLLALGLAACSDPEPETTPPPASAGDASPSVEARETVPAEADPAAAMDALYAAYFEDLLALYPTLATSIGDRRYNDQYPNTLSPAHREKARAMQERYLREARAIGDAGLTGQDRVSYRVFVRAREDALAEMEFPRWLMPINQFRNPANSFARLGSGASSQPFETVEDYENFLGRMAGFPAWADQAVTNMREGMRTGVVQPRILMEKALPQLAAQISDDPEQTMFWRPVAAMPQSFPGADRERLTAAYREAISEQVIPAYRRLHDFVRDEYLPVTRKTVGLYALPQGREWYAQRVREYTTTDLTAAEIHELGLAEVERIHGEMRTVMADVGFEGGLDDFFTFMNTDKQFYFDRKEDLLAGYEALRARVDAGVAPLFSLTPAADYEIRPVEPFREKSAAGGSYQRPSADGTRPGIFFVNTYDLSARPSWAMESLFLHEAVPGHHFQIAINQELDALPSFRRFSFYTAYTEGWALYAESLGKAMGVYEDPYQYFGKLNAELWRAVRLVVDTGIHDKGWSRQEVLDFMYANSAVNEARAIAEAERYMAIPGQALSYKIGQLKIQELRNRAEASMGERFDIRDFHATVLESGALPLDVLETEVERWMEEPATGAAAR
jgi:uncharacterized protein (DUF885 family)